MKIFPHCVYKTSYQQFQQGFPHIKPFSKGKKREIRKKLAKKTQFGGVFPHPVEKCCGKSYAVLDIIRT
jgi:hypothetical protein